MNQPAPPRRTARTAPVLVCLLVVTALIVASGFLFDLPWGLGGWQLMIVVTPLVLAALALVVVLRRTPTGMD